MERLPVEMLWRLFDTVFEENPADLYRCRAVCRDWKTCIDQHIPALYKKWHDSCTQNIPEDCIDNIVASRFPLAALPWKNSYWKTAQLPHIPRTIHKIWKNLRQLGNSEFEVTKLLPELDGWSDELSNPELAVRYRKAVAMNDKYLAVGHQLSSDDQFKTYIYKLSDMTQPIRIYPHDCTQLDFYTVKDREFIILDSDKYKHCMMSEFLESDKILYTKLPGDHHIVVGNECFSYSGFELKHYIFSNGGLKVNKKFNVPKQSFFNKESEIMELRVHGSQLLVFVRVAFTFDYSRDPNDSPFILHFCICRYNILQDSTGNLYFCPNDTNFIEEFKDFYCSAWKATNVEGTERLPLDIRLYPIYFEFRSWLNTVFNDQFMYLLVHGDQLIGGTKKEKIFIFHHWTVDEMIRDFNSRKFTLKKYTEINLRDHDVNDFVLPIGVTYIKSKLRIIAQIYDNAVAIDFPVKSSI